MKVAATTAGTQPTLPQRPLPEPLRQQGNVDCTANVAALITLIVIVSMDRIPSSSPSFKNGLTILHQVTKDHVGVYWLGGALLETTSTQVRDIPCGTKGGVVINFDRIEIDETMIDALQADCTRYAPSIEITSVRVTTPRIPEKVRRNFEQMEEERVGSLV
ncbi:hypothetical protein Hanom_Chr06g00552331 [Helianthus anomalus]